MVLAVLRVAPPAGLDQRRLLVELLIVVGLFAFVLQLLGQPVGLPVGRGGVEEQQIDLEVEQARDREEHPLLQSWQRGVQEVHRPVAGVV